MTELVELAVCELSPFSGNDALGRRGGAEQCTGDVTRDEWALELPFDGKWGCGKEDLIEDNESQFRHRFRSFISFG